MPEQMEGETNKDYEARCWIYVRAIVEKYLLQEGFYLLEDAPETEIIFAGTMDNVERAFL